MFTFPLKGILKAKFIDDPIWLSLIVSLDIMGVLIWSECQVQTEYSVVFSGSVDPHLLMLRHISKSTHHYVLELGCRVSIPVALDKFAQGS